MSQWKRIHEQATGSLPVATLTKWGAALIALLLAAFLLTQSLFNTAPEEVEVVATGEQVPAGPGTQAQVSARVREEGLRQEAQRQAAERDLQRRRELGMTTPRATASILPSGIIGGDPVLPSSEAEAELREVLRLEEIERRNRSLRSAPVAQSYRGISDNQPSQAAAESPAAPEIEWRTGANRPVVRAATGHRPELSAIAGDVPGGRHRPGSRANGPSSAISAEP